MRRQFECITHGIKVGYHEDNVHEERVLPAMGKGGGDISNILEAGLDPGWRGCSLLHENVRTRGGRDKTKQKEFPVTGKIGHCQVVEMDGRGKPIPDPGAPDHQPGGPKK